VWGVDGVDQWGVELGKVLAGDVLRALAAEPVPDAAPAASLVREVRRRGGP
jgi:glucose-6-phosphate isomerase